MHATRPVPPDALALQVGGLTRFSSVDWPGRMVAVVFVQGCPWRCLYCHNAGLQPREPGALDWAQIEAWLQRRRGLLDGVVFSGGEPLLDAALPAALARVRNLGFATGLHTAGIYPQRLAQVLPLLDWVGLDLKAALDEAGSYARVTGVRAAHEPVLACLALLREARRSAGLDYECRTTADADWLDEVELLRLAAQVAAAGVPRWALQQARAGGQWSPSAGRPWGAAREELLLALRRLVPELILRRA
ncbi:anaerobic ribonucleoside-triphosphate reductase activating protein [Pelomonas sp. CA6]|uniref:anaerobic ribonucleoside-triphosphate reductase activating protein n=1 Tax=Pelomonas sp. CA6 TaxID=2907999 RepID=UPI001F4BF740|nr:anaerobic ribonucleoside-triphosphate reductase activating protein [Pelomonas sp. CA6]MCH7343177.1 anaerobic ribonucleoside-triphosphate reductase activating protein [Pelomonas sp. CA6]